MMKMTKALTWSRGSTGHDKFAAVPPSIRTMMMLLTRLSPGAASVNIELPLDNKDYTLENQLRSTTYRNVQIYLVLLAIKVLQASSPKSVMVQNDPFPAPFSANTCTR